MVIMEKMASWAEASCISVLLCWRSCVFADPSIYQIKSNQIYLLAHKHTLQETINVKQNEN